LDNHNVGPAPRDGRFFADSDTPTGRKGE
jgi:hypothetical protein